MSDELKPCPFCGESLLTEIVFSEPYYAVLCRGCENMTAYQEREKAIAAWNRRDSSEVESLRIELAETVKRSTAISLENRAQVESLRGELGKARESEQFTSDWYKERFDRMDHWMRNRAPSDIRSEYFSIQANGIPTPWEKPLYVETIHGLKLLAKAAESKSSRLEAENAAMNAIVLWVGMMPLSQMIVEEDDSLFNLELVELKKRLESFEALARVADRP